MRQLGWKPETLVQNRKLRGWKRMIFRYMRGLLMVAVYFMLCDTTRLFELWSCSCSTSAAYHTLYFTHCVMSLMALVVFSEHHGFAKGCSSLTRKQDKHPPVSTENEESEMNLGLGCSRGYAPARSGG